MKHQAQNQQQQCPADSEMWSIAAESTAPAVTPAIFNVVANPARFPFHV